MIRWRCEGVPLSLELQILDFLDKTNGNAQAVAQELSVSPSYVYRIKNEKWQPPSQVMTTSLTADDPHARTARVDPQELFTNLIPQNIEGIKGLRDTAINELVNRIANQAIGDKSLVTLLRGLLAYETQLITATRPTMGVIGNQTNNVNVLVQQLAGELRGMPLDKLAAMNPALRLTDPNLVDIVATPIETDE